MKDPGDTVQAKLRSRVNITEVDSKCCWYCGANVAERYGHGDHFPLPKRHGGTETVPCCTSCHDMKDRFPLDRWPVEWLVAVCRDFPNLSRETRIFLAKVIFILADAQDERRKTPRRQWWKLPVQ